MVTLEQLYKALEQNKQEMKIAVEAKVFARIVELILHKNMVQEEIIAIQNLQLSYARVA